VLGLAMIFEGAAWYFAFKEFNVVKGSRGYLQAVHQGKDPTLFVVLFEDSAAMLGLIVAFTGILLAQLTGQPLWDGLASIGVGLILGATAIWLAYETKSLLIGEAADRATIRGIRALAQAHEGIQHVNEILTLHMGPDFILVTISIEFADSLSADAMEARISELDKSIKESYPHVKRVFVEAEARRR
jgi:divalent metal cation (Fe/Co/Zn/Cd) transporter